MNNKEIETLTMGKCQVYHVIDEKKQDRLINKNGEHISPFDLVRPEDWNNTLQELKNESIS